MEERKTVVQRERQGRQIVRRQRSKRGDRDAAAVRGLDKGVLESLGSRVLYYPCAGRDWLLPMRLFAPYVNRFWFVDVMYFNTRHPADRVAPVMKDPAWKLEDVIIEGTAGVEMELRVDPETGEKYRWLEPGTRTEVYTFRGETIHVHRRRGYGYQSLFGPSSLPTGIGDLGVFFYRRDSFEGGSRQTWMSPRRSWVGGGRSSRLLLDVLDKLADPGLLVTDGSNHRGAGNTVYKLLQAEAWNRSGTNPVRFRERSFDDSYGRHFQCVGYAGRGYGPTLAWQISKSEGPGI